MYRILPKYPSVFTVFQDLCLHSVCAYLHDSTFHIMLKWFLPTEISQPNLQFLRTNLIYPWVLQSSHSALFQVWRKIKGKRKESRGKGRGTNERIEKNVHKPPLNIFRFSSQMTLLFISRASSGILWLVALIWIALSETMNAIGSTGETHKTTRKIKKCSLKYLDIIPLLWQEFKKL